MRRIFGTICVLTLLMTAFIDILDAFRGVSLRAFHTTLLWGVWVHDGRLCMSRVTPASGLPWGRDGHRWIVTSIPHMQIGFYGGITIPLLFVAMAAGIGAARFLVIPPVRAYLRRRDGECVRCGYAVFATHAAACPECGSLIDPRTRRDPLGHSGRVRSGLWRWAIYALICIVFWIAELPLDRLRASNPTRFRYGGPGVFDVRPNEYLQLRRDGALAVIRFGRSHVTRSGLLTYGAASFKAWYWIRESDARARPPDACIVGSLDESTGKTRLAIGPWSFDWQLLRLDSYALGGVDPSFSNPVIGGLGDIPDPDRRWPIQEQSP